LKFAAAAYWRSKKFVQRVVAIITFRCQMKSTPLSSLGLRNVCATALVLLVCSCATTSLKSSWKSASFHGAHFKKIAVITVDERPMIRELLEGQLATQLEARGQPALRVNQIMTVPEIRANKELAAQRLRQAGADAVLVQRLVNKGLRDDGTGAPRAPATPSFASGSMGWFDYYCIIIPSPTILTPDLTQDFYIETSLHDLAAGAGLWSCVTETRVEENTDRLTLVKPLALTIVNAMAKAGAIP